MAKQAAISTVDVANFGLGGPVYAEHTLAVAKQANWVACNRPQTHASMNVGPSTAVATRIVTPTLGLEFRATAGGWVDVVRRRIKILAETVTLNVGARCFLIGGGTTAEVRFTIGSGAATVSFVFGDNGNEKTTTLATSSSGTSFQNVVIAIRQTTGGGTANGSVFRNFRIWDAPLVAGSLPDPADS